MATVSASAVRRPLEPIVAVLAVLVLALWPVEITTAFGLPAHPLILHVPVVFVPLLGVAAIAVAVSRRLSERFALSVAALSVLTLAATLLTVGAGEAFEHEQEAAGARESPLLHDHADAGEALRFTLVLLTFALVASLFARRWPKPARIALRVMTALLAVTAVGFVIRTGHLGAKMAWGREQGGAPPALPGEPGRQPPGAATPDGG
jgi:hypothetical protein